MQERRHRHYLEKRGHSLRGAAKRFGEQVCWPPKVLSEEMIYLPQIAQDRRRMMRRVTDSGRS